MASRHPAPSYLPLYSQYRGQLAYNMAGEPPATPPEPPAAPPKDDDKSGVQGRISALVAEREAEKAARTKLEAELAQIRAEKKAEEDAKLAEQGNYQKLLEDEKKAAEALRKQNEDATGKLTRYEAAAKANVDKRLGEIKDEAKRKEVASLIEGLDVLDQSAKLDTLLSLIQGASSFGGGVPPAKDVTDAEVKQARFKELMQKKREGKILPSEKKELDTLAAALSSLNK